MAKGSEWQEWDSSHCDTVSKRRGWGEVGDTIIMKEEKENGLEEAKELFKEGLKNIFKATKKVTGKIVEGFREGYAEDITKKEK